VRFVIFTSILAFFCVRVPLTETDASFSKQHPFKWFGFQWPRRTAQRLWLRTWLSQLHAADDIHFESTNAAVNEFAFEAFERILFVY
jgi:hypothetical protein